MDGTSPTGRYMTLSDYLRVLRRYRVAIVVITALGAVAGFITAKSQTPTYQASATVSIQDPSQNIALAGLNPGTAQAPGALATQSAETLASPSVLRAVQQTLHISEPASALAGAISGQVTPGGLLQITAAASDPGLAARLANTVASVLVSQNNQAAQALYRADARAVASEIAHQPGGQTSLNNAGLQTLQQQQARLAALGRFAHTSDLAEPAVVPVSASSPSIVRSTLIGLALGLLLAIAAVFVRDTLDRRLRTAEDVETSFHIPVLAHVRNKAMGKIAHVAATAKADHAADVEAFRILRRNLETLRTDSPPRSIVVTSATAEEGKTTVAGSLAYALATAGKRTLLVDCDLRQPTLASRLGINPTPGISEFLAGTASPKEITTSINVSGIASGNGDKPAPSVSLVAIPAGTPNPNSPELLGSSRFREFLQQVLEVYDVVVFDSSPLLPVADTLEMISNVDAVLVCARDGKTTRGEAEAVKAALERFPTVSAGIVITGVKPRYTEYAVYTHALTLT